MRCLFALVALVALARALTRTHLEITPLRSSNGRFSTYLNMAGFSRKPVSSRPDDNKSEYRIELERRIKIEEGKSCSCASGKLYKDCCQRLHNHTEGESSVSVMDFKADDVLRARYTAYKLGLPDYIIDSSHEGSEDYLKYFVENQATLKNGKKKWEKDIVQNYVQNKLEYIYFDILSEEVVSNDVRKIKFNAIFRESESSNILAVQVS